MKIEFSSRSLRGAERNPRSSRTRIAAAIALVIIVYAADFLTHGALRAAVRTSTSGISSFVFGITGTVEGSGFFSSHAALAQENQQLTDELARVNDLLLQYGSLKSENEELRAMLKFTEQNAGHTISGTVVSRSNDPSRSFVIINSGERDGVVVGAPVVALNGIIVGLVSEVSASQSHYDFIRLLV